MTLLQKQTIGTTVRRLTGLHRDMTGAMEDADCDPSQYMSDWSDGVREIRTMLSDLLSANDAMEVAEGFACER